MKVLIDPQLVRSRGQPVKIGNVYSHPKGNPVFKICVGIVERRVRGGPWNNIVLLLVNGSGEVCGAACSPETYVMNHHDLIGEVEKMPELKLKWHTKDAMINGKQKAR